MNRAAIPAAIVRLADDQARLAEIDENLIRNELSVLEQGELLVERDAILSRLGQRAERGDNRFTTDRGETVSPLQTTEAMAATVGLSERAAQQRMQAARDIAPDVRDAIRSETLHFLTFLPVGRSLATADRCANSRVMSATYSARQAATLCDVSEASVRRAIASGRITPQQVDGAWQLTEADLDALRRLRRTADARRDARRRTPDAAATSRTDAPASPTHPDADQWARLVEQLHRENVELAGRCGYLQSELAHARDRIALLEAPPETIAASPIGDTPPAPHSADSGSERAIRPSWWKRVLAWA